MRSIIPWKNKSSQNREDWIETPLARLRDEMDNLFERFLGEGWGPSTMMENWPARFGMGPRIDMSETENELVVKAELPGVDPKDVDIRVEGNMLTIRGEKRQEKDERHKDFHRVERQYGGFQRTIHLPSSVDSNKVDASYKDGVLSITIGKRPDAKAKKITVRTAPSP